MRIHIPSTVINTLSTLKGSGFEAFIVGGCVRDVLLGREPKDWDITTNAMPKEIMEVFPDSVYENQFGTVGVKIRRKDENDQEITEIVEVTTYRIETTYSDRRHPDQVSFAKTLKEDVSRRDFTINAMAMDFVDVDKLWKAVDKEKKEVNISLEQVTIKDWFHGQTDLKRQLIRAVGDANERFNEDALRMMRAIRFAVQLGFKIHKETLAAIEMNAKNLLYVSNERIREELNLIILSPNPAQGITLLHETGLLQYIIPEIEDGVDVTQNRHHYYGPYNTVYKHLVASLEKCPSTKLEVRLAALLHDVGKPKVKQGQDEEATFYNHEYVGAKMAREILNRLKYPKKVVEKVVLLVKSHMFYYNVDEVGEAGVRRVVNNVGLENIKDLIDVRIADRLGSGVAKAVPYKLRHFKYMVEKVSQDALSVKQLKLNGHDLMTELNIEPGPKIGTILDILLANVIDEPALNNKEELLFLAKGLMEKDLQELRQIAKDKIQKEREREDEQIKGKYWVK